MAAESPKSSSLARRWVDLIISAPGGRTDMGCLYVDYIGHGESESSKNGSFTGSFA